jgi:hypothetical protein
MVNPLEIMPILAMAIAIACIPILSHGPFTGRPDRQAKPKPERDPRAGASAVRRQ